MIGLSGVVGFGGAPDRLQRLSRAVRGRLLLDLPPSARHTADSCIVEVWDDRAGGDVVTAGAVTVLVAGEVYDDAAASGGPASLVLQRYRGSPEPLGCSALNGSYAYAIVDQSRCTAVLGTDENSFIPVYYTVASGVLCFSWDVSGALAVLNGGAELDDESLFAWLLVGGRGFEDRTRFRNVQRLEPGATVVFRDGSVFTQRPPPFGFAPDGAGEDQLLDEAAEALRQGVARRVRGRTRLAIGLSGGLDSRMVLATAVPQFTGTWFSYTYGRRGFAEHDIASLVAGHYRLPHETIVFPDELYLSHAADGVAYAGGASLFKHGVQPHLFAAIRERAGDEGLLLGSALDLVLGSTFSPPEVYDLKDRGALGDYYRARVYNVAPDRFRGLMRDSAAAHRYLDSTDALLDRALHDMPGEHPADVNDALAFHIRIRRWYNHNLIYPLYGHRLLTPTYDHAFLRVVSRVPWVWRRDSAFRIKLLDLIDHAAADIAYDETMQPAWLLPPHTRRFERLVRDVDEARLRVWFDSGRAIYLPSNRYDANFLEWLRVYPAYQRFALDLLTGPSAVLSERYLAPEALRGMVERHIDGSEANHKFLTMLMSAELSARVFVRGDWNDVHAGAQDFSRFLSARR